MFSDNALKVLEKRYFLRDEAGKLIEDVSSLFERVARAVASSEQHFGASVSQVMRYQDKFKALMLNRQFMPNSPTLMRPAKTLRLFIRLAVVQGFLFRALDPLTIE